MHILFLLRFKSSFLLTWKPSFAGKILSGEEDGLEDDAERAEVTTGSFAGEIIFPKGRLNSF